MRVLLANLAWFLSTLPDALRFAVALRNPARAQRGQARRRRETREEDILLYEPTSGSTGGTKWIPYTEQLRREFMRAVNPWMFSIYLRHPRLLGCTHYWSISPYTEVRQPKEGPRRGFAEDREYLGGIRGRLTQALFPVTAAVADERDPERHRWLTAKALLASRRLGLISVWHPSALLRLLDFMTEHAQELVAEVQRARRPLSQCRWEQLAKALVERDYRAVWPRLQLISCWDAAFAAADAQRVRELFPGVEVEGKGVLATEGVVSFPWFGERVAAITSHTLRFEQVDPATGEPMANEMVGVESLAVGKRYGVVLTTGNGFTDYRLGDVMECVGFVKRTPRLEFCYRSGGVVDLHGEKMHPAFAAEVLAELMGKYGPAKFVTLRANSGNDGYTLLWESVGIRVPDAEVVEQLLRRNYHYAYARDLGQLVPARVECVTDGIRKWCQARGVPETAAKIPPLCR